MEWILAQEVVPPGWWAYIVQGGSFALLAYIAVYLAPKLLKDARDDRNTVEKTHKDEREARDTKFENVVKALQAEFQARNDKLVTAIGTQTDKLVTETERGADAVTQVIANSCNYPEGGEPAQVRPPRKPRTDIHPPARQEGS